MPNIDRQLFFKFILDRQLLWYNRFVLGLPREMWSPDPVFKENRFTNIYRFLDRGTQFAVCTILEPGATEAGGPMRLTVAGLQNLLLYRYLNNIGTWNDIQPAVDAGDWEAVRKTLEYRHERGENIYTPAYISTYCPSHFPGQPLKSLIHQLQVLEDSAWYLHDDLQLLGWDDARGAFDAFRNVEGIGPFMAYQFLGDLRTPLRALGGEPALWVNTDKWTHIGAGALGGLRHIVSPKLKKQEMVGAALALRDAHVMELRRLEDHGMPAFPYVTSFYKDPIFGDAVPLTIHDIEHSLCEFMKYVRASAGGIVKGGRFSKKRDGWTPPCVTIPAYLPKVLSEVTS